jgi:hypothetical protein
MDVKILNMPINLKTHTDEVYKITYELIVTSDESKHQTVKNEYCIYAQLYSRMSCIYHLPHQPRAIAIGLQLNFVLPLYRMFIFVGRFRVTLKIK